MSVWTEPTAGCGNPAVVQVGALAGTAESCAMAAQAKQKTTSRIQDFMSTLHEAKAEWGIFHMLIAQVVLHRPIHLAQPVQGQNTTAR